MLQVDFTNLDAARVGPDRGVEWDRELAAFTPRLEAARDALWERAGAPEAMLGWVHLPEATDVLRSVQRFALSREDVTDVLVLGIGGSALGAKALDAALGGAGARLHFVDNVEPEPVAALFDRLDPRTTLVNVISKSGTTAETMAAFLLALDWLRRGLGDEWKRQVVVTTDPERGVLRPFAERHGLASFTIPPDVGGRFSVFSPVGLVPLALAGVEVEALLTGARKANASARADVGENLPAQTALAQHLAWRKGQRISVLMPYSTRLALLPAWFVQLHAESLGKAYDRSGSRIHMGPTPLPAVGATDQHSQVQLFREGPFDKVVVFLRHREADHDLTLPAEEGLEELGYLFGKSLFQLLRAEAAATAHALAAARRPNYTIWIERPDAYHLGWLLQHLMWQTAFLGELWNVNAFDQPGVELGKRYTYALLGRPGYEELAEELARAGVKP
ncbi:glucose-6-phosphate isomerase [Oceanithermus sp.]